MSEGLRFECQPGCTACCEQKGFVYLTEGDLERAAHFLGITPAAFPREAQCNFLRDGGCSIHPAKPTQCRTFPFWPELVESRKEWHKTAQYCPGMGQGPLVQIESAEAQAREMREAYPEMYE
jgi:hypothetical protein